MRQLQERSLRTLVLLYEYFEWRWFTTKAAGFALNKNPMIGYTASAKSRICFHRKAHSKLRMLERRGLITGSLHDSLLTGRAFLNWRLTDAGMAVARVLLQNPELLDKDRVESTDDWFLGL